MGGTVLGDPGEEAAQCVADIETADLVAVRLDTSGTFNVDSHPPVELDAYYQACAQRVRNALPLRLGLCCCRWKADLQVWELRSHEIDFWPGESLSISQQVLLARFRLSKVAAASLAEAAAAGAVAKAEEQLLPAEAPADVAALSEPQPQQQEAPLEAVGAKQKQQKQQQQQQRSRWSAQLACSLQWVIAALYRAQPPLVVHDGLLDLLQLHDKCAGDAPKGHLEFGHAFVGLFPVVFDTFLLAQEGRSTQTGKKQDATLTLEELLRQMWEASPKNGAPACFKELGLFTHRASSDRLRIVVGGGLGAVARGAMAVAEVFLLQVEQWIKAGKVRKQPNGHGGANTCNGGPESAFGQHAGSPARAKVEANGFPLPGGKRSRSALDEAAACAAVVGAVAARLAGTSPPGLPTSEAICRRFLNRVAARGSLPGYLRLDTLVQVRLAKRLKRNQGMALRLARALWAKPDADEAE